MRFLFEGRGIDMGAWGMEPATNEYRISFDVTEDLIRSEKSGSLLRAIYVKYEKASGSPASKLNDFDQAQDKLCAELRQASFQALSRLKASAPQKQWPEATR